MRKGIGEENCDYSQILEFPIKTQEVIETELNQFKQIKQASLLYVQDYETPYLPLGYNIKITLLSNWGNATKIGYNSIKFFNHLNKNINDQFKILNILNHNESDSENVNENENQNNASSSFVNNNNVSGINKDWKTFYRNHRIKYECEINLIMSTFSNLNKINEIHPNSIYFLSDEEFCLAYILIENYAEDITAGIKEVEISLDENIIYKGFIRQHPNNTAILFTSDKDLVQNVEELTTAISFSEKFYNKQENEVILNINIGLYNIDT